MIDTQSDNQGIPHPPRPRLRHMQRGQALIMTVLVMFLLAGLGGLFAAMINQSLVQTARAADRATLEGIAQAGLHYVETQLRYSPDGADWRPDAGPDLNNAGWVHYGDGFYKVTIGYGPSNAISPSAPFLSNPLDRFMKVDIEASFGLANQPQFADTQDPALVDYTTGYNNPKRFLTRKMTAFMPLALPDYLLWITNLHGGSDPAVLGTDLTLDESNTATNVGMIHTLSVDPTSAALLNNDSATGVNNALYSATISSLSYLPVYDGPIRSEVDLQLGQGRFDLTSGDWADGTYYKNTCAVLRNDLFEVVGNLSQYEGASAACRRLLVNNHGALMTTGADPTSLSPVLVPYLQTQQTNPIVQPLHAPSLDSPHSPFGLNRYRALTRDSGVWQTNSSGTAVNTGYVGWGEGLYINNPDQIQYGGDLDQLRGEWMRGSGTNWNAKTPGIYDMSTDAANTGMVMLIFHGWEGGSQYTINSATNQASFPGSLDYPQIEVRWYGNNPQLWTQQANGDYTPVNATATAATDEIGSYYTSWQPYPRNGVIFAEGNVMVKGNLPESIAFQDANHDGSPDSIYTTADETNGVFQRPRGGGFNEDDGTMHYYVNPTNRRFDLTVVSGGTIYIDGNVLSPSSRHIQIPCNGANGNSYQVSAGSECDSKLALMAMDNVCLNPTRLFAHIASVNALEMPDANGESYYDVSSGLATVTYSYATAGAVHPRTRLILRHAGLADSGGSATAMQMVINANAASSGITYNWGNYCNPSAPSAQFPTSLFFYDQSMLAAQSAVNGAFSAEVYGGPLYHVSAAYDAGSAFNRQCWPVSTFINGLNLLNTFTFQLTDPTTLVWPDANNNSSGVNFTDNYLLSAGAMNSATNQQAFGGGCFTTCVDLEVDALVYAQRGSWFVIPGQYWNNDLTDTAALWPAPKYHEPYDVRILVNGSIVENRPAPADMEAEWLRHWRGADIWYYTHTGSTPDMWDPGSPASAWNPSTWRCSDNRRLGITYQYDATLARPVCFELDRDNPNIRYYRPRLPKLPLGANIYTVSKTSGV